MSRGLGWVRLAILELMRDWTRYQRTPQRQHWYVGDFVRKIIQDDPETGAIRPMTGRQVGKISFYRREGFEGFETSIGVVFFIF
jgi:hypothetical protein